MQMNMIAIARIEKTRFRLRRARRSSIFTHFSSPQEEGGKLGFLFTHSQGENPNGIGEHNLNLQEGTSLGQARGWGGHPIAHSVPGYYGQRVTRNSSIIEISSFVIDEASSSVSLYHKNFLVSDRQKRGHDHLSKARFRRASITQ